MLQFKQNKEPSNSDKGKSISELTKQLGERYFYVCSFVQCLNIYQKYLQLIGYIIVHS